MSILEIGTDMTNAYSHAVFMISFILDNTNITRSWSATLHIYTCWDAIVRWIIFCLVLFLKNTKTTLVSLCNIDRLVTISIYLQNIRTCLPGPDRSKSRSWIGMIVADRDSISYPIKALKYLWSYLKHITFYQIDWSTSNKSHWKGIYTYNLVFKFKIPKKFCDQPRIYHSGSRNGQHDSGNVNNGLRWSVRILVHHATVR